LCFERLTVHSSGLACVLRTSPKPIFDKRIETNANNMR
jgi:hypothetical protein